MAASFFCMKIWPCLSCHQESKLHDDWQSDTTMMPSYTLWQ